MRSDSFINIVMKKDPRVDRYILSAAAFAKPILKHLRKLVHQTCPDVQETIKWSFPHFEYRGKNLCSMAAFKAHCAFGFSKAALMKNAKELIKNQEEAMGHLGRITSLNDLPADRQLTAMIEEAMMLNETNARLPAAKKKTDKNVVIPDSLSKKFSKEKKAADTFFAFSPSHQREYCEWIAEAKSEDTRKRRTDQAIEWLKEGKSRNWKYMKK